MRLSLPGPGDLVEVVRELTSTLAGIGPGLTRALALVPRVETLLSRIDDFLDGTDRVLARIEETVGGAAVAVARGEALLTAYERPLHDLAPALHRLAETLSPAEVDAAVSLVDRLPGLLESVDADVLPMLMQLRAVGPDLHELLDIVDDVRRMLAALPGVGLIRRDG